MRLGVRPIGSTSPSVVHQSHASLKVPYDAGSSTRARTRGVMKVTATIARRASMSGPARLRIDPFASTAPPGGMLVSRGPIGNGAPARPAAEHKKAGAPEDPGQRRAICRAYARRRRRSAKRLIRGSASHALCAPDVAHPPSPPKPALLVAGVVLGADPPLVAAAGGEGSTATRVLPAMKPSMYATPGVPSV